MAQDETQAGSTAMRRRGQWIRWNRQMTEAFLSHLAGSCNVAASARAIGVTPTQVHHRRRTNTAFAQAWAKALDAGYQLLETRLLGHVLRGGGDDTIAPDDPDCVGPVDWEGGIKLLTLYRARRDGRAKAGGFKPVVATRDETDAAILKKLAVIAAARTRQGEA